MKLDKYLEEQGWTPTLFARKSGLSYTTIFKVVYELKNISLNTALTIVKATDGQVTYDDLAFVPSKKGIWPAMKHRGKHKNGKKADD